MKKDEAKNFLKIDHLIFNKKTNQIVSLCSQWSEDFDYEDDKMSLFANNYNGFNVFPGSDATIKVGELEDWEPASVEKLQEHPVAYCNYLMYRHTQLVDNLSDARLDF